ncbi:endonuclease/exonuclease/phosphatase family protein [Kineococcus gynurae]|uniref:Endonuclease/exonuclease/phosphatase family protein n=1 Tax=Kineococcus gynurae TaxID=452979 RepID=A0ABV5LVM2_9ACTN
MSTANDAAGRVRILTWNVWWRFGDWRARREVLLDVIRDADPDVVGLQEVWGFADPADPEDNLAWWLADRLGYRWEFSASSAPHRWQNRLRLTGEDADAADRIADIEFGNAVLSRHPLRDKHIERLSGGHRDDEGRTALQVTVDLPTGSLPFTTTHLNSAPYDSAVRHRQLGEVVRLVAGEGRRPGYPPVLTGDFNAVPESDEVRYACGYLTPGPVRDFVLLDAWRFAEPGDPGLTWNRRNPFVARVHQPSARIDYVLVGLAPFSGEGSVLGAHLVGTEPVDGIWPSDHAAIVVDLRA